ncbi:hypothetical protein A3H38_02225 [candidate division WOR-1 bacterium RIFCSPLOWO2_02_FULL_46_20]|uniref:PpiC domain-containing protein n=2 Tax=Saganbacteria TaxID=1703751 RepID=A0A1F4RAF4_UNCSA|nr:MAG: hypothetical protein A3J44_05310 [candidate division WOR-1 bacterium RIFCSPHIGHO2_02_FULL_45_12]OGC04503.1 MAG: hypothetical protein A3H38_02225 [candidate division WOR-1 bacterium RIFCSPLOWO2_02_FULL_46_20]OGC08265.1 MAG: hypothetical protein A3F86_04990 [candidate division WOR-1 bacterium RIFCSPLOWO2_12_FULL_45_9]
MLTFLRKKMKAIMIIVAVVFAASMFYGLGFGGGGREESRTRGLAKVNGKEINFNHYRETMNRLIRQSGGGVKVQDLALLQHVALGQSIDFMLILAKANREVRVGNQEVSVALDGVVKQEKMRSVKEMEQALKNAGVSLTDFKAMLKNDMMVQKVIMKIREGAKVTPDDLREVRASHILVSNEAQAQDVLARARKRENFASLAEKNSLDPGSAKSGGDLGFFSIGMMVEAFEKAAFSLKVGEISDVVKSPFGFHIIKVTDSKLRKFEGEEKDIEKAALQYKQEAVFRQWFSQLKGKAKLEITSPALKGHDFRFKGMLWQAIQEYKKAILEEPANPYLHVFLGDTYVAMKNIDLAIAEYETAVGLEGGNPELYMVLAEAYEQNGKKAEAIQQYERASLVAGDNKALHEKLLKAFKKLKAEKQVGDENAEIKRIEKKEKFEKELKGEN